MPDAISYGLRIHYAAAPFSPRRPAIVLLHGAGANHTVWLGQMKVLREQAWVVLPDLPGHGRSEEIPGLTIDEYAAALAPFLERLRDALPPDGPRRLVLGGHSMGGAIALTLALSRPDLLSGLVLVGSGAKLRVSQEILAGLEAAPKETQALIARWSFSAAADPALIMRTMRDLAGVRPGRTLADFRACNGLDLLGAIESITLPALILCGAEDRMTPPKYSFYMAERIHGARAVIIEGVGHGAMIEASDMVSSEIARFLETLPAA